MSFWNDVKNFKMPEMHGVHMPDSGGGDDTTSIIIFVIVVILALVLFRKLAKLIIPIALIFLLVYFFA